MRVRAARVVMTAVIALSGCAVIQRASLAPTGEPTGASVEPALSLDGSVTAFASTASNLVLNDTNGVADVFVRDAAGTLSRVSVAANGAEADGPSSHPSISGDGSVVAFQSDATNLVASDTNATTDIFVRDRTAGTTTRASVAAPGAPASTGTAASASVSTPVPSEVAASTAATVSTSAPSESLASQRATLRARAVLAPQRVIVRTTATFAGEGRLSGTDRTRQRQAIRRDQDAVATLIGTHGRVTARARTLPIIVATVDAAALDRLSASPSVVSVTPDDPLPTALAGSGPVVGLPATQDAGYAGRGQSVAILDTGVDSTHTFLGNRIVDEACYSAAGNCPNGLTSQSGPGSAAPCTYAPIGCRHGTHVAGIAAGSSIDATGVAPRASILAVQIFSRLTGAICTRGENPCPLTFPSDWILGLEHVYELRDTFKIAAVNMSIGGITSTGACDSDAVKPAIDQLRSVGIATVIAAGNEGLSNAIGYPACISSSVAVGASDDLDGVASFSNSHPLVRLFAPGVTVRSSVPGGGFANFNGTSMATPHVAGAFALAKEQDPTATVDTIVTRMTSTGRTIRDVRNGLDIPRLCTSGALGFDRCPNRNASRRPSLSGDGQRVAFESDAPLVAADTNAVTDIYLRNLAATTTERISVGPAAAQGSAPSTHPAITFDGDRIAFDSLATQLVTNDSNGVGDVFVRNVTDSTTMRVSVTTNGSQLAAASRDAAINANGTLVAFASPGGFVATDTNGITDIYLHDLDNFDTALASVGTDGTVANGESRHPAMGRDRFVLFESDATNLGLGTNDTNDATDVYVRDRYDTLTQRVSTGLFGTEADAWSGHPVAPPTGGIFAMSSTATNLVTATDTNGAIDIYRRAIVAPIITGYVNASVAPGETGAFIISGRGFLGPLLITSTPGITLSVTAQTPNTITGTVTVVAGVVPGRYNVNITSLSGPTGFFGGTLCPGCLTVS